MRIEMPSPSGEELKAARLKTGLSQVDAAALMGYPVQTGSRGGLQSRTWQALESTSDPRNMPGEYVHESCWPFALWRSRCVMGIR